MRGVSAGAVPQTEDELEATLEAEAKALRGEGRGWFSGGGGSDASTAKRIDTLDKRMELLIRQQVTRPCLSTLAGLPARIRGWARSQR